MNYDALKDFISQFLNATPEWATVICLIMLGYGIKFVPKIPNKIIPLVLLSLSIIVYPMIADNGKAPYTMRYPVVRQMMTGVVLWFIAWSVHTIALKQWIDKFMPKTSTGDTKFFADKPAEPEQPKTPQ